MQTLGAPDLIYFGIPTRPLSELKINASHY